MKKSIKVCLILSSVFIVLGIGISASAVAMGGTLDSKYRTGLWNYVDRYEASDGIANGETAIYYDIKKLDLDIDEGSIELIESADTTVSNGITVSWDAPDAKVKVRQSGNTLEIDSEMRHYILGIREPSHIRIEVPAGYTFSEAEIDLGAAEFTADFLYADKLKFDVGVGSTDIVNGMAKQLEVSGGVGSFVYQGSVDGDITLEGGVGNMDLTLAGMEEDFNYELICGVGSITVGESTYGSLGSERKIDHDAGKKIDADCGVGSISIQFEE